MSTITVIGKLAAQPGMRRDLVAALQLALDNAEGEPGTLTYILHEDVRDESLVWFYEVFADQAAFDAHRKSDGMKAVGAAVAPYAAGRTEVTFLRALGGKGI